MEITLPGYAMYQIPNWDGKVEVSALKIGQYRRIVGSYSETSLYRKILKTFKGKDSPVALPATLKPEDIDFAHFLMLLTGVVACHERSITEKIKCQKCKAVNPRVLDIIQATTIKAPKDDSITKVIEDKDGAITCARMTVGKYLELQTYVDNLYMGSPEEVRIRIKEEYGEAFSLEDDEDILDLKDQLLDVGSMAALIERNGLDFKAMFLWLANLQGKEGTDLYNTLDTTVADLSAVLTSVYKDKCSVCGAAIEQEVSPVGYFFSTRQLS